MLFSEMSVVEKILAVFVTLWGVGGFLTYAYDFLLNKKLIKYENTTYPIEKIEATGKSIKALREICQMPKRGYGKYSLRLRIYRFFSIYTTRLIIATPIAPNHITLSMIAVAIIAAILFGLGSYLFSVIAALLLLSEEYIDCWDGELARFRGLSSLQGVYLDGIAHTVIAPAIYAGITIGVFITTNNALFLVLGFSATIFSAIMPSIQGVKESKFLYKLIGFSKGHGLIDLPPKKESQVEYKKDVRSNLVKFLFKRGYNFLKFTFLKYVIALATIFGFLPLLIILLGIIYPILWLLFFIKEAKSGADHLNHLVEPYRPEES